jgi:hypothetical protein
MGLASLERYPEDVFEPLSDDDPLPEELELVLDGLEIVPDEPLLDMFELEPLPMCGQGLHSPYDNPHVCPRTHVQAKSSTGSRGQLSIPMHVPPPEFESDPGPDDCITHVCQCWFREGEK